MYDTFEQLDQDLKSKDNKIIHQIWFDFNIDNPNLYSSTKIKDINLKRQSKCKELNKDWKYMLWNNKYGDWLIENLYPWFSFTYNSYPYPIQKVDAIRYFILFTYGGFYMDIDTECFKSMNEVRLEYPGDLYFVETGNSNEFVNMISGHKRLCNSFIYSSKNHPFWPFVFEELMKNKEEKWYQTKHLYIMYSTGPTMITNLFFKLVNTMKLHIFPKEKFSPCCSCDEKCEIGEEVMIAHFFDATWTEWDTGVLNFVNCNYKLVIVIVCIVIGLMIVV